MEDSFVDVESIDNDDVLLGTPLVEDSFVDVESIDNDDVFL